MIHAKQPLIGLEIEFHVVNAQGVIVNEANKILNDSRANEFMVPEVAESMIEIISEPKKTIQELNASYAKHIHLAKEIAKDYGLRLIPASSIGYANIQRRKKEKFDNKEKIMGPDKINLTLHVCGTHVHVDKSDHIVKQHTIMTALDPLFVLMSSSPFFNGENNLNDYRVKVYRNGAYENFQAHGGLLPYVKNKEDLEERYVELFSKWIEKCTELNCTTHEYTKLNTCWGPIRFSEKTIESRVSDSNILSNVMALATVFLGINRRLEDIKLEGETYYLDSHPIPTFDELKSFERAGIEIGLADDVLYAYLSKIVSFSEDGLYDEEKKFLTPFKKMLANRKNFADEITQFAKESGEYSDFKITPHGSNLVRLFIAEKFEGDLDDCLTLCR
jgi:gamma-glutamyl:cysteine ligase YbdK (ATP-grasp superfamily)